MMCESETMEMMKYTKEIGEYQSIEDSAIALCHEEFDAELTDEDVDEIEVYLSDPQNPDKSPRVDSLKAVGLVHRYVQSLPTDRFTDLQPYWDPESKVDLNESWILGVNFRLNLLCTYSCVCKQKFQLVHYYGKFH